MKIHVLSCIAVATSIAAAASALAHPGGGMMRGLGGMSMGSSLESLHGHALASHESFGSQMSGRGSRGTHASIRSSSIHHRSTRRAAALSRNVKAANILGNLNSAHASSTALQHASPHSMVGAIATYKSSMHNALALTNPTDQANAIIAARQQLALRSNKRLTPTAITRVDGLIGISGADPTLGTTP